MPLKAIFLDRDGTLIKDKHFLSDPSQIELFPQTIPALKNLRDAGYHFFVVTNQSGIARGYFDIKTAKLVNAELARLLLENGITIGRFYICPHHEKGSVNEYSIKCDCRKPETKFFLEAEKEFGIDKSSSYMIGDKISDIMFGKNAGIGSILVRTGYGRQAEAELDSNTTPTFIADNLSQCAEFILRQQSN